MSGHPYRYAYITTTKPDWFLFTGFVKHDLLTGESWGFALPEGIYASEAPFCPHTNAQSEDDGYLVRFLINEAAGTSECILVDAKKHRSRPGRPLGPPP